MTLPSPVQGAVEGQGLGGFRSWGSCEPCEQSRGCTVEAALSSEGAVMGLFRLPSVGVLAEPSMERKLSLWWLGLLCFDLLCGFIKPFESVSTAERLGKPLFSKLFWGISNWRLQI